DASHAQPLHRDPRRARDAREGHLRLDRRGAAEGARGPRAATRAGRRRPPRARGAQDDREGAVDSLTPPFWESPENVARFAAREPDVRLAELIPTYAKPRDVRVLDLGCAAGRNAVLLASKGFDVEAVDSSSAMVAKTRERLAPVLGEAEAERRVRV